jgi:hypothetical protein
VHVAPVPAPVTEHVGAVPLACTRPSFTSPVAVSDVKLPVFGVVAPIAPGVAHGTCDCAAVPAIFENAICDPLIW